MLDKIKLGHSTSIKFVSPSSTDDDHNQKGESLISLEWLRVLTQNSQDLY